MPAAFNTVQYEGYGPGGTAVLIECSARERCDFAAYLRRVFAAHGGFLGAQGSVSYLFARTGVLTYAPSSKPADLRLDKDAAVAGLEPPTLADLAIAAGAEDVQAGNGGIEILTDPEDFLSVRTALSQAGFVAISGHITQRPASLVDVNADDAQVLREFVADLATLPDVQDVYTNARLP